MYADTAPHQMVTRDHLDVHPQGKRLVDCFLGVGTRRVEESNDAHPGVSDGGARGGSRNHLRCEGA